MPTITSPTTNYSKATNGSAMSGVLFRGDPTNAQNIIARCSNINWNIGFNISDVPEVNTRTSQETVNGRQDMINGQIGLVMNLQNNDQLPTSRTLKADEAEMTLQIMSGDDSPLSTVDGSGNVQHVVTDVFVGVKISNKAGGIAVNQLRMTNVGWIARDHYTGAEWKLKNASASYPATVA
jgi:hypothetical protein